MGIDATRRVIEVFGGQRIYVPEPSAKGYAHFAAKLGLPEASGKLAFEFGGGQIVLPLRLESRNDEILRLRREALGIEEIARRLRVTERYVYRVFAQDRTGGQ